MSSLALRIWMSILLAAVGVYAAWSGYHVWARQVARQSVTPAPDLPPVTLDDVTLTDTEGKAFPLSSMKGKVWVASFFFSTCPGTCLQMNRSIAALRDEYAKQDVKFVSISVDPTMDTPERLKSYSENFEAKPEEWKFLTGDFADVQQLGLDVFKVSVGYKTHSEKMVLIDAKGKVRGFFNAIDAVQVEKFRKELDRALADAASHATDEESDESVSLDDKLAPAKASGA